jgi:glycosyltransferase involved in cell wall biosynthesis
MSKTILIISNTAWSVYNFRKGLINSLIETNSTVIVLAPYDEYVSKLDKLGCSFLNLKMDTKGKNPLFEINNLFNLHNHIKKINPDVILSFTIKPNIYSALSARLLKIPILINITGLGDGFSQDNLVKKILIIVCRFSFKKVDTVFFQNIDDKNLFLNNKIVSKQVSFNLPGSGADLEYFQPLPKTILKPNNIIFCMITRLLWEKGIEEYIDAIRIIKKKYNNIIFQLIGKIDDNSKKSINPIDIKNWTKEGLINYLGFSDDIRQEIRNVDCLVLPSYYREGVPRSLIEGISMGKPIITTNHIGCKEVVNNDENGYLCEIKNVESLANALEKFILLPEKLREQMSFNSRAKAIKEFDEKIVINNYLNRIFK